MDVGRTTRLLLGGSVVAALAASACCLGPLVLVLIGAGSVGAALALAPYRPYLLGLTFLLLGYAFYLTYRNGPRSCGPGESCQMTGVSRRAKTLLWVVALLAIVALAFPYYSAYLF